MRYDTDFPVFGLPMSFLSLVIVFLLEQLHPLSHERRLSQWLRAWADFLERHVNAGSDQHGILGTALFLLPPVFLTGALWWLAWQAGWLPLFLLNVLILSVTMGFRGFSHVYAEIQLALRLDEREKAEALLAEWRGEALDTRQNESEIARLAIETALAAAHHRVFAVMFWFSLAGPLGALLYRLLHLLSRHWQAQKDGFGKFAQQLFVILDWLPARMTATAFALVGNFLDAMYSWRNLPERAKLPAPEVVLATGAGALGVRLGIPMTDISEAHAEADFGAAADADAMQSATGLVWRGVVLWLFFLLQASVFLVLTRTIPDNLLFYFSLVPVLLLILVGFRRAG
ncbi:MAG: CobD/CbiB family protein [Zoogloeaceae bacterium]|nr:CobD/CbiB family protein [Zoogloeaceae bacterium]